MHEGLFDLLRFAATFIAGMGLGAVYFGGLWLTVRRLPSAPYPGLLMGGSFVARLALCVIGFYFVMNGQWPLLVAAMLGFLGMRALLVRMLGHTPIVLKGGVRA